MSKIFGLFLLNWSLYSMNGGIQNGRLKNVVCIHLKMLNFGNFFRKLSSRGKQTGAKIRSLIILCGTWSWLQSIWNFTEVLIHQYTKLNGLSRVCNETLFSEHPVLTKAICWVNIGFKSNQSTGWLKVFPAQSLKECLNPLQPGIQNGRHEKSVCTNLKKFIFGKCSAGGKQAGTKIWAHFCGP